VDVEIRTIAPKEFEAYVDALAAGFGGHTRPEDIERERMVAEIDRCLAALDGPEIVGGASAASFTLTVPGGTVPAAGVTGVAVKPTHRRQGINSALMRRQLDDVRANGEPLAILYASEGGIYGRFGYGLGSFHCSMDVDRGRTAFVRGYRPSGRTRLLDREDALAAMRPLHDRVRRDRPGGIELDPTWFAYRFAETRWGEDRKWFYAVHEGADGLADLALQPVAGPPEEAIEQICRRPQHHERKDGEQDPQQIPQRGRPAARSPSTSSHGCACGIGRSGGGLSLGRGSPKVGGERAGARPAGYVARSVRARASDRPTRRHWA